MPEGGAAELRRLQFLTDSKAERFPLHRLSFSHLWVSTKALQREDSSKLLYGGKCRDRGPLGLHGAAQQFD